MGFDISLYRFIGASGQCDQMEQLQETALSRKYLPAQAHARAAW